MTDFYLSREESLLKDLEGIDSTIEKIDRIISFIIDVRSTLSEKMEYWIKKTLPLCREENYEKGLFSLYTHLAYHYIMNSQYSHGKTYLEKASQLNWSNFLHSLEHMYFYHAHGLYYHFTGDKDLALEYFQKCLELAKSLDDTDFSCQMLNNISFYYMRDGGYQKAEAVLLEAFSIIDPEKNPFPAIKIMENLGHLYIMIGEYEKALDYLDSALSYAMDKHIDYMMAPIFFNYGLIHEKKGDNDRAEKFLRQAHNNNSDTYFSEEIPMGLARFLFKHEQNDEAKLIVDEMLEIFSHKGMMGSLDKVYHLMDEYDI